MINYSKHKMWLMESMVAAVDSVEGGTGLREASRVCKAPVET